MTNFQDIWRKVTKKQQASEPAAAPLSPDRPAPSVDTLDLNIPPHDPLLTYVLQSGGVLEVDRLRLDSPALDQLRQKEVKVIVPLVSQGELIGLINLGSRLSEQEYSSDDRKLLGDLAGQAAPALRVAQLVREQQEQVAQQQRLQQELRVARLIQQTLLPQEVPQMENWKVTSYYQPAREVGGDFYDFIYFPDGKIGFIVADVTDKGVPAALVMATTRSILRAAAERLVSPGAVLQRTNDVLHPEIPPKMFVTCFYALLDPATGELCYANAGHDVPYRYTSDGIVELRATGMPLGLMPGMHYEEKQTTLTPGEYVLLYSDGLVEAHDPQRQMFGFPRLQALLADQHEAGLLKEFLLAQLAAFTGPDWIQEDDVTLVTLQYQAGPLPAGKETQVVSFTVASAPGNERQAIQQVEAAVANLDLPSKQLERLKTAVGEATMNAMEHGNEYDPDKPVEVRVEMSAERVMVCIRDQGGSHPFTPAETPDLEAKLSGQQSPRGWGLFLIQNMVDDMRVHHDEQYHTVELVMNLVDPTGE